MGTTPVLFDPGAPLTVGEAATALKTTKPTLCRWINYGHVQVLRELPGHRYLIATSEVDRVRRELARGIRFGRPRTVA